MRVPAGALQFAQAHVSGGARGIAIGEFLRDEDAIVARELKIPHEAARAQQGVDVCVTASDAPQALELLR